MVLAVTFDFWNTIAAVPGEAMAETRRRAVAAACAEYGAAVEEDRLDGALEAVRLAWERSWSAGIHLHPGEGAAMLADSLELTGPARDAVSGSFLGALREAPLELSPDIEAALEALSARGLRLGIVCDAGFSGGELLRELLHREGLAERFEAFAFSDEVGRYKPAPEMFEAALAGLGAEPSESLHVGDLRRTDVAGAAALGMRTVRYRGMLDDADPASGAEAEFVLDGHMELLGVLDRLAGG